MMMYKRAFGKKGLVAALLPKHLLNDKELLMRLEGAAIQCGITQEYAIDFLTTVHSEDTPAGQIEAQDIAHTILERGYRAVISVSDKYFTIMSTASAQVGRSIMHIGLSAASYEEQKTFRMTNLDPLFEKNISSEDRLYVIDKLAPDQIARRLDEQRHEAREQAAIDNGFVGVVGPDGRPSIIRIHNDPELSGDNQDTEEEIFEA